MPRILDYALVLEQLQAQGLRALYYNGGAFGFAPGANVKAIGWISKDDPSLRPEAQQWTRRVPTSHMPSLFERARTELLPAELWIMPKSHWAFELDHSTNATWLPDSLKNLGTDSNTLRSRTDASPIAFNASESSQSLVEQLLSHLNGSDFAAVFPARSTLCTIHHHQQLWWQTTDPIVAAGLESLVQSTQSSSSSSTTG